MSTEIRSHTGATESASDRSLDMFGNDLVFDRKNILQRSHQFNAPSVASFENADKAFWGKN
jgi:hypothetical protein